MSFEKYIDGLHRKIMGTLIFLNHIKDKIDNDTRVLVVQSLPLRIWSSTSKTQIQRIQKLQNLAAKIAIGKVNKYDHASPYINQLK